MRPSAACATHPAVADAGMGAHGRGPRRPAGNGVTLFTLLWERMKNPRTEADRQQLERTRRGLVNAALSAYEDASLQGLCAEGAWEAAVSAMRALELNEPRKPLPFFGRFSAGDHHIRAAHPGDALGWARLRQGLWPSDPPGDLAAEVEAFFAGTLAEPEAVLVAESSEGALVGFAELSLRPYAEDCTTTPVGYLEGWYVVPEVRGRGVGRALVTAAEAWAREQGCSEFASDTRPENTGSIAAHLALGFEDAGALRCFRKTLQRHTT
jgi:aminoglycoside 6'-N-acetyltransferase I